MNDYGAELLAELESIERWTFILRKAALGPYKRGALESLAREIPQRRYECRGWKRQTYYVRCWVFSWCRKFSKPLLEAGWAHVRAGRVPPPMPRLLLPALRTRNRKKQIRELIELSAALRDPSHRPSLPEIRHRSE
jgi:endonuclease YncB( thermonuclease family)